MSSFATLAPVYSMPAASPGDVDLSDASSKARARALNDFLAGVELRAFKIAVVALRHEDDALDAVQDAMLHLARAYGARPQEEWKPLFYRILENRIRDVQRRRMTRNKVIAWLPFRRGGDEDDEMPDPIEQAAEPRPAARPAARAGRGHPGSGRRPAGAAPPPAAGLHAPDPRRHGRGRDGRRHGLL